MSKINCSLIKDLLPLYIDDLCSKDTSEIVSNHLEICEDCNKEYETLKTEPKVKPQQDNSQELIKKVNKKFGKDKKWAVIKTVSIILAIIIVAGVVAFFKVPLYVAKEAFQDSGFSYPENYETWEIGSKEKKNFSHKAVDMYINENFGKYEVSDNGQSLVFKYEDGKKIIVYYTGLESIPSWDEDENVLKDMYESYHMLPSVIKRGLENLGVNTEVALGYDRNVCKTLIKTAPPEVKFFCSYDSYATACAYYGCFNLVMPCATNSEYYLLAENDEFSAWGWTRFTEDFNTYLLEFQSKKDLRKSPTISVYGFTKEEAQEIFKYAVIK